MSPQSSQVSAFLNQLRSAFAELAHPVKHAQYVVAFSGGVDSHALLFACKQLDIACRAVHIHHGIQAVADHWVDHCQQICESLEVPFDVIYVDGKPQQGKRQSPEEAARLARYEALYGNLNEGDCLLTAQHKDDQAETLLLQLMRGANSAGLAGMPAEKLKTSHDKCFHHIRPLLSFTRAEIENFAYENELDWVEDPSNQDINIDRNFIRQQVMPMLATRWPEVSSQLTVVAGLQADNVDVLESMAATDLACCQSIWKNRSNVRRYDVLSSLSLKQISNLSQARILNLLRYWIIQVFYHSDLTYELQSPTRKLLKEILTSVICAESDSVPRIAFCGIEFRRYRDHLVIVKDSWSQDYSEFDGALHWLPEHSIEFANTSVHLVPHKEIGCGLTHRVADAQIELRFRQGGEEIKLAGRAHNRSLKKLLQASDVPPWDRDSLPLFYIGDELIAVADLFISDKYKAEPEEQGWILTFENAES